MPPESDSKALPPAQLQACIQTLFAVKGRLQKEQVFDLFVPEARGKQLNPGLFNGTDGRCLLGLRDRFNHSRTASPSLGSQAFMLQYLLVSIGLVPVQQCFIKDARDVHSMQLLGLRKVHLESSPWGEWRGYLNLQVCDQLWSDLGRTCKLRIEVQNWVRRRLEQAAGREDTKSFRFRHIYWYMYTVLRQALELTEEAQRQLEDLIVVLTCPGKPLPHNTPDITHAVSQLPHLQTIVQNQWSYRDILHTLSQKPFRELYESAEKESHDLPLYLGF